MQVRAFSGQRLEQARLRKGMTQTDLAYAIRAKSTAKTSERNVRRWEAGTTNAPHAVMVSILAEVLGIPMDELYETERLNGSSPDDEEDEGRHARGGQVSAATRRNTASPGICNGSRGPRGSVGWFAKNAVKEEA